MRLYEDVPDIDRVLLAVCVSVDERVLVLLPVRVSVPDEEGVLLPVCVGVPDEEGVLLEDADDESELIELAVELNPGDAVYERRADPEELVSGDSVYNTKAEAVELNTGNADKEGVELSLDVEDTLNPVDAV